MAALPVNGSARHGAGAKRLGPAGRSPRIVANLRLAIVAAVGLCLALTGCTVTATGHPAAAPDLGRWHPPLVTTSHLADLLLGAGDVNATAHTSGMALREPISGMVPSDGSVVDLNCLDAYGPLQHDVYQGSNWRAVQGQYLNDASAHDGHAAHLLVQGVVAFGDADSAQQFFGQAKQHWSACSNRQVTVTHPGHDPVTWDHGALQATETTLTMAQTMQNSNGIVCQRAIGLANNVIIDTMWCGFDTADQAGQVVTKITDTISQA